MEDPQKPASLAFDLESALELPFRYWDASAAKLFDESSFGFLVSDGGEGCIEKLEQRWGRKLDREKIYAYDELPAEVELVSFASIFDLQNRNWSHRFYSAAMPLIDELGGFRTAMEGVGALGVRKVFSYMTPEDLPFGTPLLEARAYAFIWECPWSEPAQENLSDDVHDDALFLWVGVTKGDRLVSLVFQQMSELGRRVLRIDREELMVSTMDSWGERLAPYSVCVALVDDFIHSHALAVAARSAGCRLKIISSRCPSPIEYLRSGLRYPYQVGRKLDSPRKLWNSINAYFNESTPVEAGSVRPEGGTLWKMVDRCRRSGEPEKLVFLHPVNEASEYEQLYTVFRWSGSPICTTVFFELLADLKSPVSGFVSEELRRMAFELVSLAYSGFGVERWDAVVEELLDSVLAGEWISVVAKARQEISWNRALVRPGRFASTVGRWLEAMAVCGKDLDQSYVGQIRLSLDLEGQAEGTSSQNEIALLQVRCFENTSDILTVAEVLKKRYPNDEDVASRAAIILEGKGKLREAAALYQLDWNSRSQSSAMVSRMANLSVKLKDDGMARELIGEIARVDEGVDLLSSLGLGFWAAGRIDMAFECLQKDFSSSRMSSRHWPAYLRLLVEVRRPDLVELVLQAMCERDESFTNGALVYATSFYSERIYEIPLLDSCEALRKEWASCLNLLRRSSESKDQNVISLISRFEISVNSGGEGLRDALISLGEPVSQLDLIRSSLCCCLTGKRDNGKQCLASVVPHELPAPFWVFMAGVASVLSGDANIAINAFRGLADLYPGYLSSKGGVGARFVWFALVEKALGLSDCERWIEEAERRGVSSGYLRLGREWQPELLECEGELTELLNDFRKSN
ncbi:hypothetical protein [Pelagicoccus albus]|uniref:Uncharacterized protein n=1 Tax=Pelagicoccus albus TaxID=415222 RepID=A0A7X1B775_9BACT|nr:hypothetical protein [Pelagicoccus albus]MBC2606944.1 hypothetical protein [Pelagicoccus albus]